MSRGEGLLLIANGELLYVFWAEKLLERFSLARRTISLQLIFIILIEDSSRKWNKLLRYIVKTTILYYNNI